MNSADPSGHGDPTGAIFTAASLTAVPLAVAETSTDPYARLRGRILSGELTPNERLVEGDLVTSLGVGRATVRAILGRLEHEGLIVREPNRGARVRMVAEAEALEITQARAALESLAARHAAERATADDVQGMRELLQQMTAHEAGGNLLAYSDGNARLHSKIIAVSGHQTAARLIAGLQAQMVRFQYRTVLVPGRAGQSLAEHTAVVKAIAEADPDAAETAMRRHLSHVAATLKDTTLAHSLQQRSTTG